MDPEQKKEITIWIGTEDGLVASNQAVQPTDKKATRIQGFYRGIKKVTDYLSANGFSVVTSSTLSTTVSLKKLLIDFKVTKPQNVAYITSGPNYRPDKAGTKESNATVHMLDEEMDTNKFALEINVAGNMGSWPPIFVPLDREDSERQICLAVVNVLRQVADTNPKLKEWLSQSPEAKMIEGSETVNEDFIDTGSLSDHPRLPAAGDP